ncbi:high-affinity choline transporter 1-like isoform X4 [Poeciliopsis prolifica]|nr:high-affinity choline transporter 1-like isoform X4 [Poeciliopsis prolifica]
MRNSKYITMMDPFQIKYGKVPTAALSLACLVSEIMWVTGTLIGLGVTMSVILDLSYTVSIWISAAVAITYTLLGGLYSVAYTDIIQLVLIFISLNPLADEEKSTPGYKPRRATSQATPGYKPRRATSHAGLQATPGYKPRRATSHMVQSWLCVPFALMSPAVSDITKTAFNQTLQSPWVGSLEPDRAWRWIDNFLLLGLGNLGLQNFHQRTLSASSSSTAKITCFAAAFIVPTLGIPPILLGAAAASTNWNLTSYGSPTPHERGETGLVLPLVLQHLTPSYISIIGIGAVAAAVMSSTDSALLSAASIFTSNIYKSILRTQASDQEIQWVIRCSVIVMGLAGTSLTFLDNSVLMIWLLRSDLTYTLMLPQLICVLFFSVSNGYGAVLGCVVGVLLRLLCGEPVLGIPAIIKFPGYTLENGVYIQRSPIRTICMLSAVISILLFSYLASVLFKHCLIPEKWDVFNVKSQYSIQVSHKAIATDHNLNDPSEDSEVCELKFETKL